MSRKLRIQWGIPVIACLEPNGDCHNGGLRVYSDGSGRIIKPRSMFWEWLLLSNMSPLKDIPAVGSIDTLFSYDVEVVWSSFWLNGSVEQIGLPGDSDVVPINFTNVGELLAVIIFFGLGDIHHQNIRKVLVDGKVSFVPIDIESVFHDYRILSQTRLVPSTLSKYSEAGLSELLKDGIDLSQLAMIGAAFWQTLMRLEENRSEIAQIIEGHESLFKIPIRVIPRPTRFYNEILKHHSESPMTSRIGLHQSEIEQLLRGDIPYYFHFPHECNIYYLDSHMNLANSEFNENYSDEIKVQTRTLQSFKNDKIEFGMIAASIFQIARSYLKLSERNDFVKFQTVELSVQDRLMRMVIQGNNYEGNI
jgi:hypothetical protein